MKFIKSNKLEKFLKRQRMLGGICVFGNTGACKPREDQVYSRSSCLDGGYMNCRIYMDKIRGMIDK